MFLDDVGIERIDGLRRTVNPPERHPQNPLLVPDTPWEQGCQVYGTAYYDEAAGRFKLWYLTGPKHRGLDLLKLDGYERAPHTTLAAYAESKDGVNWVKPKLGIFPYDGGAKVMRVVGSSLRFRFDDHAEQIRRLVGRFREAVKVAADNDLKMAVENHIDFTADEMLVLLEAVESPFLGLNFDTGNFARLLDDPVQAMEKLAPYTLATHHDIAMAAVEAGKHVFCEKPFALNAAQARKMLAAAQDAGVVHYLNHNYRRCPAVMLARQLIDDGRIGRIFHWRGAYLQSWIVDPSFPLTWQLQKEHAGSGSQADLNSHSVDLARFLVGEIRTVSAVTARFISERPLPATGATAFQGGVDGTEKGKVTVDDAVFMTVEFENGVFGRDIRLAKTSRSGRLADRGPRSYRSADSNSREDGGCSDQDG